MTVTKRRPRGRSEWTPSPIGEAATEPRERILAVAADLFYREGVRGVGIDRIIRDADVAKATFYRHFPSKDELVLAWLRAPQTRGLTWLIAELSATDAAPTERLLLVFDLIEEWMTSPHFRGCAYINTSSETPEVGSAVHDEYRREARAAEAYLARTATEAGVDDPSAVAAQLMLLIAGAITRTGASRDAAPIGDARRLAQRLLTGSVA
ncbi:MAG: TetR/AcrR family transcriptional regulator [Ilumatobacteraceae bacterium]